MAEILLAQQSTAGNPEHFRRCASQTDTSDPDLARLVRILAARVIATIPRDAGIELADLIQAGNVGLLQAIGTYSPKCGVPLAGYAKFRIRGEILDTVRRHSDRGRLQFWPGASAADSDVDIESSIPAPAEGSPLNLLAKSQRETILGEEVARLPPRYQAVVRMRYAREFSLREIGTALRVHESRACQLHRSALCRLRRALSRRGLYTLSVL